MYNHRRTDAKAEDPTLWPPDLKGRLIRKDPDAGKDWRQEEKGKTEWYRWMASLTQWTWAWANWGRRQRTGKLGMPQLMGSQRVGHNWLSKQQRPHKVDHLPLKNKDISSHIRPVYSSSSSVFHILIAFTDTGLCPRPLHFLHYSHTSVFFSVVFHGQAHFCFGLSCNFFTLSLLILTFQVSPL